jgi:hypothetical protein
MEAEPPPGSREHAIGVYRRTILQAAERGAESNDPDLVRRVKRRLAQSDLFFLLVYVLRRADLNRDWFFARLSAGAQCRELARLSFRRSRRRRFAAMQRTPQATGQRWLATKTARAVLC